MTTNRPGLLGLIKFEARKFASSGLPWCLFALIIGVTLILGAIERSSDEPTAGYALYAHLITRTLPLTAFLAMILGSLAVNHELGTGSLRALLLRPVRRLEVIAAKISLLFGFSILAGAVALFSAWAFTSVVSSFGAIVIEIEGFEPREVIAAATMSQYAIKLSLVGLFPILAATSFGMLVSVLIESEGSAVAGAIVGYLAMQALGPTVPAIADWLFPSYLDFGLGLLEELAREDQSHEAVVAALGPLSATYLVPFAMALLFACCAMLAFHRKDLPC